MALGVAAVIGGAVLLQNATSTKSENTDQVLAADREAEGTANRGGERSDTAPVIESTTVTEAPTSTEAPTTVAPTTTAPAPTAPPTTPAPVKAAAPAPKPAAKPAPAPKPAPSVARQAAAPAPAPAAPPAANNDVWTRLAKCESGMRNDLGAPYYGYFQFSPATWRSIGGTGLPSDHSYEVQLEMAKKLQARSGWGQWPVCGKKALAG